MVTPAWGSFQKPNQMNVQLQDQLSEPEKEFDQELSGEMQDQEKPEAQKPQWGIFQSPTTYQGEPDPTEDEDLLGYTVRNLSTNASRLGEQYFGRFGNVEKMGKDILTNFPQSAGVIGWALSKLMGQENWEKLVKGPEDQSMALGLVGQYLPDLLGGEKEKHQIFPTSKKLKEFSERETGGYTKAKTKGEEKFQEFTEDVGATLSGSRIKNSSAKQIGINNILIPAAANVTKKIVEDFGFGQDKANMAKMAVWMPLTLAANVNASKYAANLTNQGRQGFSSNLTANIPRYQNQINQVSRNMLQGDPRSALAQQQLAGINNDIASGQTSMQSLMTRYDAINAAKRDRGLFQLGKTDRDAAIYNINQVLGAVREEIEILGQSNPQALQSWQNGIQAFSTIHKSKAMTNWVESIAKGPYAKILSAPAAALFGVTSYGGLKSPLIAGPSSVAGPALYKVGQTIYRMWNDPNLADYYWKSISAALKEDVPAFINNFNKLNKNLEKSDSVKKKGKSKEK
jgi:hypothetical protein